MLHLIKIAAQKMLLDFEGTRGIKHNPTKGRARESLVIEQFLRPYLPGRFEVTSGLILDAAQNESRQQDLMIHDAFYSPVLLDMESDRMVFPESVFATLEVKSRLTNSTLRDIVAKAADIASLTKSASIPTFITPGVGIPSTHASIFSAGICFESDIPLEDLVPKVRAARSEQEKGYWLSMLLVLRDKNGASGLVVNVNNEDVQQVQLIPTPESRLMLVRAEEPGDALLYFYLHLTNHLRLCGLITPGPNLAQYAEASGLGKVELTIGREEFIGASMNVEGEKISLSAVDRLRELVERVFGDEGATDNEIIEFASLWPQMPQSRFLLDSNAEFRLSDPQDPIAEGECLALQPRTLILAAQRSVAGKSSIEDAEILGQFIALVRRLKPEGRAIIGSMPTPSPTTYQYVYKKK